MHLKLALRYVLNADEYDDSMFQGPPRNLPRDEVFNLFGECFGISSLEKHLNSTLTTVVDNEIVEVLEESHWSEGEGEESWKCLVYQIRPSV